MARGSVSVINVVLEDADCNWLRVYSDDLPGLILSGPDRNKVCAMIKPAITALLEHEGLTNFVLLENTPISGLLRNPSPRSVDVHVKTTQYVVQVPEKIAA